MYEKCRMGPGNYRLMLLLALGRKYRPRFYQGSFVAGCQCQGDKEEEKERYSHKKAGTSLEMLMLGGVFPTSLGMLMLEGECFQQVWRC